MSQYIVSARKYRPDSFGTLIGQDNIARTLSNSIKRGQLAHAYLFCGPRGVGKTTTARIFAKMINCAHGEGFSVVDTSCASVGNRWSVFGDGPAVRAFADKPFLEYTLKDRLSDASVSVPSGVVAYNSFSENPEMASEIFSGELSEKLLSFVRGSGYAPAFVGLDLSAGNPTYRIRLDKRALKGTKVQVLERDTTVVVPTGLFPVQNYQTGKTNYLYQNDHLSICLNDENGKGVWGIPFKERLCGKVENIDYYNNGKIQFLFCAGSHPSGPGRHAPRWCRGCGRSHGPWPSVPVNARGCQALPGRRGGPMR